MNLRLLYLGYLLALAMAVVAKTATSDAPLVPNASAAAVMRQSVLKAGRCVAVDLNQKTQRGTLESGSSAVELPAGRYRLHALLALAPLGDLHTSAIAITLAAGNAKRTLNTLHFAHADEFTDQTLDVDLPTTGRLAFSIGWVFDGLLAKKNNRVVVTSTEPDPDKQDVPGDFADFEVLTPDENGTIPLTELPKIKNHLAVCGVYIEQLTPVQISAITTDKIVYKPGGHGTTTITLTNVIGKPVNVVLKVALNAGLTTHRELATATILLPAGGTTPWTGDFSTDGLHWGTEIVAEARVEGYPPAQARAVFGVTDNFWETAIVGSIRQNKYDYVQNPTLADEDAAKLQQNGYTAVESGFWAPDEFGQYVPDKDRYFGGQYSYPGSLTGTKNIIAACRRHGIATTLYALLYGGDGAPTMEMMRKHPDWFSNSSGATDWAEQWYLQETGKTLPFPVWMNTSVNTANSDGALHEHAAQLIASHRILGWDGVRYDSYFSNTWVKAATQRVRAQVQNELPDYRFGYNSYVPYDVLANSLDTMVGGGNLVMEESLRDITKRGGAFSGYAKTALTYRDIIWPHGGQLGVCYDAPGNDDQHTGTPLDALYLATIMLASGVHPYYDPLEDEIGHHARFALRYSEFLYRNTMRPLLAPETVIAFGGTPALLEWKRLARAVDLDGDHHRLLVHLLNAPANDQCMGNPAMKMPAPLRNLPITVTLPAGAVVDGAWLLSPIPDAHHDALATNTVGTTLTLTVPEVRFWGVVVIDYTAPKGLALKTVASDEEVAMHTPPKDKPATAAPAPPPPLTDEEAAAKAQVVSPAEWRFPPSPQLRVLAVHGRWYPEYGVERALARLGGAAIDNSWEFVEGSLRFYPNSYEELMRHQLVVVGNVGAHSFTPVQRKMLKDYVAQGGTLLFLGGWYAFGPDYHNSLFEEISPVSYPEKRNDPPNSASPGVWQSALPDGLVLTPGTERLGTGLNWAAAPRVFWYHPLVPKPGTTVLLTAGGKPLLVAGAYGKGRVAVFAGTVMGVPPAGKLPFWQWDGWPSLLAETMHWLVTNATAPSSAWSTEARGKLSTQLFGHGAKKATEQTALIARAANICPDKETAKMLLRGIAELEGNPPPALIDQVGAAIRPYLDGSFTESAQQLLDSGQSQKVSLGLRIMGGTKAPTAPALLDAALETGEVSTRDTPAENDAGGQLIEDPAFTQYTVRLGALEGLGQIGNPASLPALRSLLQRLARTKSKTTDTAVYLLSKDDELYLQTALAALRCGDTLAAGPVIDALLANQYVITRQIRLRDTGYSWYIFRNDVNLKAMLANVNEQFPRVYARQQQLYAQLTALPPAILPTLAQRIAAEEDPLVVPLAFAAFGRSLGNPVLSPGVITILKTSKLPAVAELANEGQ